MSLILGIHVGKTSSVLTDKKSIEIHEAIVRDVSKLGLNAAQIFTHGPRNSARIKMDYPSVSDVCSDIDLTVHSSYGTTTIWKNPSEKSITLVRKQLFACKSINAWALVIHINKVPPSLIAERMKELLPIAKELNVMILLEMIAAKADPILTYETNAKLDRLCSLINDNCAKELHQYYGINLDTAHLWGAGFDVRSYDTMEKYFANMKFANKIRQFHLNGSSSKMGSGKDTHEIVFSDKDLIWGEAAPDKSGVRAVVEFAYKHSIPIVCEINRGSEQDAKRSLSIVKKFVI